MSEAMAEAEGEDQKEVTFEFGNTSCLTCGRSFQKRRSWAIFCCNRCRMRHHQEFRSDAVAEYRDMLKKRFTHEDKPNKGSANDER